MPLISTEEAEKNRLKGRTYYYKNKEKCAEKNRKWREKNRDRRNAYMREYSKKYYQALEVKPYTQIVSKYRQYKASAKRRGIVFEMTKEQFKAYTESHCSYCGFIGEQGVDRIDNTKGYVEGNMCACCSTCNFIKRDRSVEEFINHCKRIIAFNSIK